MCCAALVFCMLTFPERRASRRSLAALLDGWLADWLAGWQTGAARECLIVFVGEVEFICCDAKNKPGHT